MKNAVDISKYTVSLFESKGDLITNKKLQKLLYYIDAWHLAYFNEAIITEDFEAWVHGPVIPGVYREFKTYAYGPISLDYTELSPTKYNEKTAKGLTLSEDSKELIDAVLDKYGAYSSFQLELLSHSEAPWLKARAGYPPEASCNNIIDKDFMKNYYSQKIYDKA